MSSYVHLHLHSEYSLVDSVIRLEELIERCVELNLPAVALTDRCNFFGAVKFYQEAVKKGIKPIFGAELYLQNPENNDAPFSLVLLCQNELGYKNLTRLISRAYLEGQHAGIPYVSYDWFDQPDQIDGLIALSGEISGDIGQAVQAENLDLARDRLSFWLERFKQRFYLEIARLNRPQEEQWLEHWVALSQQYQVPLVASCNARFLVPDDFEAHEARVCIYQGRVLEDPKRPKAYTLEQYLKSPEQMQELFADLPEALQNSMEIAKRCNLTLSLGKAYLPHFPIPEHYSIEQYFSEQAQAGFEIRLKEVAKAQNKTEAELRPTYQSRLQLELDVINSMGFAGYFLIVADFISWAKQNDIPVGPGRGSGAGSLVAYALGITGLDPLDYDLLFERFLNPERISMPDFDIDFCMDGRDRVIDYVAQRYGTQSVSQIITFGTMAAKAVVRDVGRVLGHPYGFVDKIAKLVPFEIGMTLDKALQQEEQLQSRYQNEEEVKTLIDLALKLEGLSRNAGKHAGGVVIAPTILTDFTPLYLEPDGDHPVTQFDKDDVEAVGLVKFDFLGLRTLTIIHWAVKIINQQINADPSACLNIEEIPLTDVKSFDLLKRCETTGVFQLESRGMKDLIRRLQPDCFEDIIALVALFRPGPLQSGMVDDFIDRKHGRAEIQYPHPELEPILRPTYGVILYQEQVMQIAQVLAGYTLGAADLLRRAMGKKKPEEMAKQREIFTQGAKNRGVSEDISGPIFDLMEKFAGYGFNKSHSAAYALVSYQTAWLKANYPAPYMAAVLSSDMDNTDKVANFIEECRRMNIEVLPPDLHLSNYSFTVTGPSQIRYGLGAIKGVGESAIEIMILERQKSSFKSLADFCERVDTRKINRRVIEALIKSGAMMCFYSSRAHLLQQVDSALLSAEQRTLRKSSKQLDLFGEELEEGSVVPEQEQVPTSLETLLSFEKDTLGFYFSSHPTAPYQTEFYSMSSYSLLQALQARQQNYILCGYVSACRTMFNRRQEKIAFFTLEDSTARIEIAAFADVYRECAHVLSTGEMIVADVQVSTDDQGQERYGLKRAWNLTEAREIYGQALKISLAEKQILPEQLERLLNLLKNNPGKMPLFVQYQNNKARVKFVLPENWRIKPKLELMQELKSILGEDNVSILYKN